MALPSSSRNGARVIWVALHTAEGARRRGDLYNFFNNNQNASSHVGIDGGGYDDWVSRDRAAWTLLNGNPISVNAELCGFARWTREQWLSTGVVDGVDNPRAMVRNAAAWAKRECEALGIPKQYIGTDGVRARRAGIIIHWDYSRGTGNGDHWDTGSSFPWDVFFADMGGAQEEEDMDYETFKTYLHRAVKFELRPGEPKADWQQGPTFFEQFNNLNAKLDAQVVRDAELARRLDAIEARLAGEDPPDPEPEVKTHKVVPGDTLYSLAKKHNTTVERLRELNPALQGDTLIVDSVLRVG